MSLPYAWMNSILRVKDGRNTILVTAPRDY